MFWGKKTHVAVVCYGVTARLPLPSGLISALILPTSLFWMEADKSLPEMMEDGISFPLFAFIRLLVEGVRVRVPGTYAL